MAEALGDFRDGPPAEHAEFEILQRHITQRRRGNVVKRDTAARCLSLGLPWNVNVLHSLLAPVPLRFRRTRRQPFSGFLSSDGIDHQSACAFRLKNFIRFRDGCGRKAAAPFSVALPPALEEKVMNDAAVPCTDP